MKKTFHLTLLALWIFTVAVPSLVTVYSKGENVVFVMNLGDEEQQEEGKKDSSEEKIIPSDIHNDPDLFLSKRNTTGDNYILGRSNHAPDITLPPPEHKI
ncbi:hypothetical protein [Muriicola sp. Z0-33]|uniref:hypothetical protein n=1 Tax=Muriicola sp. Z0-33 TaxID=2816957 RepID=UPI002238A266|nr:hypothetical protein [Muriicola sp. Z0-33]MCW5514848.1 hypothetical protein [Muriicola sp. Z0-33]